MSYESGVLTDVPSLFWRLNQVGPASNNDEITDISGNDLHGTLEFIQPGTTPEPYGYSSPIETDADSREFRGFNDGIFAATRVARIGRDSDALIEPTGDFTLEGWLRLPSATGGSAQFGTVMQPMFGRTGSMFIYVDNFNTLAGCLIDSAGNGWLVVDSVPVTFGQSYYVALVRSANVLSLQVNDSIRDITTVTSGLPNKMDAPGTFLNANGGLQQLPAFFVHPFQIATLDARYDEIAFYTFAVDVTRRIAHYNAALNATSLVGYSNVVPSAILYSGEEPPPISFPFRHNWSDPLIERISFSTNISKARSAAQENSQPMPTPRREIEISQMLRDDSERRKLRAKLWAHQDRTWFVPMREDFEQLISTLSSGGNSIPVSPQYKDYEVDSWIGVRQINDQGQVVKSEELEIQSLNEPTGPIITKTNLVNSYSPYVSYAYPVRRAIVLNSVPIRGHTDAVEDLTIVARLLAEDEEEVPNRITPWTPTISYEGYEVFDPAVWISNDWSDNREYGIEREMEDVDFEVGAFGSFSDTNGAEETFSYKMPVKGRDKIAQFLGWFYARAGALTYLWVPTMQKDFEFLALVDGLHFTVKGTEYSENYALAHSRKDLAFVYYDNTMALGRVSSFTGSPDETLGLTSSVPTQTNLRSISLLKFCRLDASTLEIAKYTDDVWSFAWKFRELLFTP